MANTIAGAPPGLDPILFQAANKVVKGEKDILGFISGNDLSVLAKSELRGDSYYPDKMRLPLPVPGFLMKEKIGVSPSELVDILSEAGVKKLEGQKVELSYDPGAKRKDDTGRGVFFVRVYEPNPTGTMDVNGNPASNVNIPGQWLEISPKVRAEKKPVDTLGGHKKPIAERVGDAVGKYSSDPRMGPVKKTLGKIVSLQDVNGQPPSVESQMQQVLDAAKPGPNGAPSKLDVTCMEMAALTVKASDKTADGQIDWAKPGVAEKVVGMSTMIKQGLLGNAMRVLAKNPVDGTPMYKSLEKIAAEVTSAVNASDKASPGQHTEMTNPKFKSEFEGLVGGKFVKTEAPTLIGNGQNEVALAEHLKAMKEAKSDINQPMWEYYNDDVGIQTTNELAAAAKRGVKVNVVVDGNVASRDAGREALLKKMEDAGVTVVRAKDPQNPMNGMHSKGLLVDCSAEAIAKGYTPVRFATDRNYGTQYMKDQKTGEGASDAQFGWSGTDFKFTGAGAAQGMRSFANVFNAYAPPAKQIKPESIPGEAEFKKLSAGKTLDTEVVSFSDVSGPNSPQSISKAIEKASNAVLPGQTLVACNAYFMGLPGVEETYKRAIDRGVNLDLATNSSKSIDVPVVSVGINMMVERLMKYAQEARVHNSNAGKITVSEYDEKQTMHDKTMIFGDQAVLRMSWNQHGRSQELESEDADMIFGKKAVADAKANFQRVKAHSKELTAPPVVTQEERGAAGAMRNLLIDLM